MQRNPRRKKRSLLAVAFARTVPPGGHSGEKRISMRRPPVFASILHSVNTVKYCVSLNNRHNQRSRRASFNESVDSPQSDGGQQTRQRCSSPRVAIVSMHTGDIAIVDCFRCHLSPHAVRRLGQRRIIFFDGEPCEQLTNRWRSNQGCELPSYRSVECLVRSLFGEC